MFPRLGVMLMCGLVSGGGFVSKPDSNYPLNLKFQKAVKLYQAYDVLLASQLSAHIGTLNTAERFFMSLWEKEYIIDNAHVIPDPEYPMAVHKACYNINYMEKFIIIIEQVYGIQII